MVTPTDLAHKLATDLILTEPLALKEVNRVRTAMVYHYPHLYVSQACQGGDNYILKAVSREIEQPLPWTRYKTKRIAAYSALQILLDQDHPDLTTAQKFFKW